MGEQYWVATDCDAEGPMTKAEADEHVKAFNSNCCTAKVVDAEGLKLHEEFWKTTEYNPEMMNPDAEV